ICSRALKSPHSHGFLYTAFPLRQYCNRSRLRVLLFRRPVFGSILTVCFPAAFGVLQLLQLFFLYLYVLFQLVILTLEVFNLIFEVSTLIIDLIQILLSLALLPAASCKYECQHQCCTCQSFHPITLHASSLTL